MTEPSTTTAGARALLFLCLAALLGALLFAVNRLMLPAWLMALLALAVFAFACGKTVTGRWLGALIDERNVISLSRFQTVLWTLLVLSAYLTAALYNIFSGQALPLKIEIQEELWWLIGISTASLVASPLILNTKAEKVPDAAEVNKTLDALQSQNGADSSAATKGHIMVNTDISGARWSDMFTGEEVGNAAHMDVARLQMFLFTIITVIAFGVVLAHMFAGDLSHGIASLPTLDKSMVALIAISHGGYLTSKAVPHSQTGA
jgi:hypothetical protein